MSHPRGLLARSIPSPRMAGEHGHPWPRRPPNAWVRNYRIAAIVLDAVLSGVAATVAVLIRYDPEVRLGRVPYLALAAVFPLLWVSSQAMTRSYEDRFLGTGSDEFKRIVRGGMGLTAAVCFVWSIARLDLSRTVVGIGLPLAVVLTLLGRFALRKGLHWLRRRGRASHRVLVLGDSIDVGILVTSVRREPQAGFLPIAACLTDRSGRVSVDGPDLPVVGTSTDVLAAARAVNVDTVAVCGDRGVSTEGLRKLAWDLHGTGVGLVVAPALTNVAGPRIHVRPVAGLPLLHLEEPVLRGPGHLLKTGFDRTASSLGLLLLLPLLAVVAVAVRAGSPGPVFFRQARVGRDGAPFRVWKFRTMYVDAEERLVDLVSDNESDGLLFKLRHDVRITPIGRTLRRCSIDELPQLLNVLRGDMSLVGPRPLPNRDRDYQGHVRRRLLVRPGITGLWQVSGRSTLSWEESVRLDLYYVDNWSLMFDFMILWKTLAVVVRGHGAY
jgi:exopolysaccharide biosynthesis polyprenyl glycosylphosphotransferase